MKDTAQERLQNVPPPENASELPAITGSATTPPRNRAAKPLSKAARPHQTRSADVAPASTGGTATKSRSSAANRGTGRPRGRPPKDSAPDNSREKLLDAAVGLFAAWGYDPVSTAAIADAAGLAQSMVHYHFGSKEQLWHEAIERLMRRRGRFFPVSRMEFADISPLDRLRVLLRRLVEANAAEPNYARILMHEAMARTPRLNWLMERYVGPGIAVFNEAISDALEAGLIKQMPVHDISNIITSAASLTFSIGAVSEHIWGHDVADEEHVRSYSDSVVTILMDGLIAPRTN